MYRQRILEQQAEIEKNKPKGVPIFKVRSSLPFYIPSELHRSYVDR